MARINLSIPDGVKERMDGHPGVNWSQAATEFFSAKLNEIESTKEVMNMTDAIARLKASKAKYEDETKAQGHNDGVEWAMKYAEYDELCRLSKHYEKVESGVGGAKPVERNAELEHIVTDHKYDIELFDESAPIDAPSYLAGFVAGALEVFSEV